MRLSVVFLDALSSTRNKDLFALRLSFEHNESFFCGSLANEGNLVYTIHDQYLCVLVSFTSLH